MQKFWFICQVHEMQVYLKYANDVYMKRPVVKLYANVLQRTFPKSAIGENGDALKRAVNWKSNQS